MNQFNPEFLPPTRHPAGKAQPRYSTFLPFLIVLCTLIFSTTKDAVVLYKKKVNLVIQNSKSGEPLETAGKEAQFVEKLHVDLEHLAPTDPIAAKILAEFFPPPATPKLDVPDQTGKTPTP